VHGPVLGGEAAVNPAITVLVSVGAGALINAFVAYFAFRVQFERFIARDTEREKYWTEWRTSITSDVEQLKAERNFHTRIEHCEKFIDELRDWKHQLADPHIRVQGDLKRRIEELEQRP
jgi:hypothetical protein